MLDDLLYGIGATLVYLVMGVGLLVAGFLALDAVTPGRLGSLVMGRGSDKPSMGAGLLAAAAMLATGLVVFTALWTNVQDGFGQTVLFTVVFGLIGVGAQAASFLLVDLLTPGRLGREVLAAERVHPGALLAAAAQLATAGVVCASIA